MDVFTDSACCGSDDDDYDMFSGFGADDHTRVHLLIIRVIYFVSLAYIVQGVVMLSTQDLGREWNSDVSISGRTSRGVHPNIMSACILLLAGVSYALIASVFFRRFRVDLNTGRHHIMWITESVFKTLFFFSASYVFGLRDVWLMLTFGLLIGMSSLFKLFAEYVNNGLVAVVSIVVSVYVYAITYSYRGNHNDSSIALQVLLPVLLAAEYLAFYVPVIIHDTQPPRRGVIILSMVCNLCVFSLVAWLVPRAP